MNKPELMKAISDKSSSTMKDTKNFLNTFVEIVTADEKGDNVALASFSTFSVAIRAARTARSFKAKEIINIPRSKILRFKIGKKLKDAVN